jgi:hypothetical protein
METEPKFFAEAMAVKNYSLVHGTWSKEPREKNEHFLKSYQWDRMLRKGNTEIRILMHSVNLETLKRVDFDRRNPDYKVYIFMPVVSGVEMYIKLEFALAARKMFVVSFHAAEF